VRIWLTLAIAVDARANRISAYIEKFIILFRIWFGYGELFWRKENWRVRFWEIPELKSSPPWIFSSQGYCFAKQGMRSTADVDSFLIGILFKFLRFCETEIPERLRRKWLCFQSEYGERLGGKCEVIRKLPTARWRFHEQPQCAVSYSVTHNIFFTREILERGPKSKA